MAIKVSEEFVKKFGKKFPPEAILVRQGEPGHSMFLIQSGKVAVFIDTSLGEKTLSTLKAGDFFGEMALVGSQPFRGASVKTVDETVVLELNREAFEMFLRRSPEIGMSVIKVLADRLRDANAKTAALVHRDDLMRIATYLSAVFRDKGVAAKKDAAGRMAVVNVDSVVAALGVSTDSYLKFVAVAKKANVLGQNGAWLYAPQPGYLVPLADHLLKAQ